MRGMRRMRIGSSIGWPHIMQTFACDGIGVPQSGQKICWISVVWLWPQRGQVKNWSFLTMPQMGHFIA
jgi:hypothetical protein